ncbi:MAG: alpha-hydroxy acid oxidase [Acidimicrobiales bacterium]
MTTTDPLHEILPDGYAGLGSLYDQEQTFATVDELFAAARENLDPATWDFLDGGAGEERTLAANRRAFGRWSYRPRVMSGVAAPDTSTSFMGIPLSYPVMTSPFGAEQLFHPDGHLAVARANAASGVASIVPEAGSYSLEDVAESAPTAARMLQLHPLGRPENFRAMLTRAEKAGYTSICLTVDCPTAGWRERNMRNRFNPDPRILTGNYRGGGFAPDELLRAMVDPSAPIWEWGDVAEEMAGTPLPFMAKGILTATDARAAVEAGAGAVLVSNHGGRQLDGAPAALDQLPEIVAEVGDEVQIALDSGIRRGSDIVTALALGADVVVLGRAAAMALAADGEAGVRRLHKLLRDEMTTVMRLLGRGSIADLGPDVVAPTRS